MRRGIIGLQRQQMQTKWNMGGPSKWSIQGIVYVITMTAKRCQSSCGGHGCVPIRVDHLLACACGTLLHVSLGMLGTPFAVS